MMLRVIAPAAVAAAVIVSVACGRADNAAPASSSAPAPAAAPGAAAPKPTETLSLLEPAEGAMGGHIDMFRWSPVGGADGYVIRIVAVTGNRLVWESEPMTATETKLPPTVALEPEVHTWSVTALKGGTALATSATQRFTITP
jgi:hypothetical protein